jgi:hypothetical protein
MAAGFGSSQDGESETHRSTSQALNEVDSKSCFLWLLSLQRHCAEGANGEAGPKGEHRRCEVKKATRLQAKKLFAREGEGF